VVWRRIKKADSQKQGKARRSGRLMKFKVLYVIPQFSVGGREKVVASLMEELDRGLFEPSIVCLRRDREGIERFFPEAHTSATFLAKKEGGIDFKLARGIRKLIVREKIAIVHCHNPGTLLYGGLAGLLARYPVVINTEHGYSYSIGKGKRFVEGILRNRIEKTVAVCEDLKRKLCETTLTRPDKIQVVRNGISVKKFLNAVPCEEVRKFRNGSSEPVIAAIGRLDHVKGHQVLIEAIKGSESQGHPSKLVIVGNGPLRHDLETRVRSLGLEKLVWFMGARNDIPEILSAVDIFVLPSLSEGLSITLLEAMAAGKAVIATNVGGNPEVIADGIDGLLVPQGSPGDLAQRLMELTADGDKREALGRAAAEKVSQFFPQERFVREMEGVYLKGLERKGYIK
jgi:glycosyltransferase involved in cell wall biosynthesis